MNRQAQATHPGSEQVLQGRFELRNTVLHDGFGEVKAALDRKTGKEVSLRALHSAELTSAVRKQLQALSTFTHPNLVRGYGVLTTGPGAALLVQGPLHGHHLGGYVAAHAQSGKPISLRGAYNVVAHVCNALSALHATGPHGAVRPTAVWIGDDGKVQLADLVLARAALAAGGTGGLPEAEAAFLAPELKAGHPPTLRSDIFGLGALLYVLLTGRSPMDAFVMPSQVHGECTQALDAELIRALSPDPAARHATPDVLRSALLALMENVAHTSAADDFGLDIEVEVNLASLVPGRRPTQSIPVHMPQSDALPNLHGAPNQAPEVGARVSLHEPFRPSLEVDAAEAAAARNRTSLGEVDLKDVLAKITEDDSPRWMVVKNGMDHGPFSGRQLVNMIVQGEALSTHELMNTDTGTRGKLSEFAEFQEFLAQYELRRTEVERAAALASVETKEKHSTRFKMGIGFAALGVIGLALGFYALSRSGAGSSSKDDAALDMYRRGEVAIEGSAGILPTPRGGGARRPGGGGGGGPGSASYEEAMMQAVDLGSAHGAGEQQLSAATVAGVMNKHLNQLYGACVRGNPGSVKIDIAIAGSGQVLGVSVNGGDGGLQRCVADQVRRIRFPSFSAPRMGARYSFGK